MAKDKGTNGYVARINKSLREQLGVKEIPVQYDLLIRKTAQDMRMLDRIIEEIDGTDELVTLEKGSTGQHKTIVNPLVPYYDKLSSRVTDDLYNLGLTACKQAAKSEDPGDRKSTDKLNEFLDATQG